MVLDLNYESVIEFSSQVIQSIRHILRAVNDSGQGTTGGIED